MEKIMKEETWIITGHVNIPGIDKPISINNVKISGTSHECNAIRLILYAAGSVKISKVDPDTKNKELYEVLTDKDWIKYSDNTLVQIMKDKGLDVSRAHIYRLRNELVDQGLAIDIPKGERVSIKDYKEIQRLKAEH